MNSITLKNFRCFREEQTARLAPLTLLVGENSTGKTSFLAMMRALWDVCYRERIPDFKEEPYDLGSFDEIAHHRGGRGGRAHSFEAGFNIDDSRRSNGDEAQSYRFNMTFGKDRSAPVLRKIKFSRDDVWFEVRYADQSQEICFGAKGCGWITKSPQIGPSFIDDRLSFFFWYDWTFRNRDDLKSRAEPLTKSDPMKPANDELKRIEELGKVFREVGFRGASGRPYASAPVRSKPRRTYDPSRQKPEDPEGDDLPMYLSSLSHPDQKRWDRLRWNRLKKALEDFGKEAGLFDEIHIRHLGKRDSEPFQVQVRKSGRRLKGPRRNLIDVGYGVSQALPVITELLEEDAPPMFLLQQPEVHLHPSAQAALGSLFCQVANSDRQLLVETHSDHLLDRVRMDVRDSASDLKPDDVSILFFERNDLDVRIHSLGFDEEGNVIGAPDSYGKFFMEETRRSLWKR
ncbi:MAG: AAA family ATPase [Nitrospinae bacterium]|nr:AAA family ATPase [Nitrospinota bacterium]